MLPEIHSIAQAGRQRVPGMTKEEVEAEMIYVLWQARLSYSRESGVPFPAYWWSCWMNRKRSLLRFYFQQMRDHRKEVLFDDRWTTGLVEAFPTVMDSHPVTLPEVCTKHTDVEREAWALLGSGVTVGALKVKYGRHTMDTILRAWRSNPNIKEALT
jgi:hypothetical protein